MALFTEHESGDITPKAQLVAETSTAYARLYFTVVSTGSAHLGAKFAEEDLAASPSFSDMVEGAKYFDALDRVFGNYLRRDELNRLQRLCHPQAIAAARYLHAEERLAQGELIEAHDAIVPTARLPRSELDVIISETLSHSKVVPFRPASERPRYSWNDIAEATSLYRPLRDAYDPRHDSLWQGIPLLFSSTADKP